jgi:hypothetical protein
MKFRPLFAGGKDDMAVVVMMVNIASTIRPCDERGCSNDAVD